MKTSFMLTASMASAILAYPFDARSQQCNVAPSAATNAKIQPISQPSAATADACMKSCSSNASCKSFIFGLPANAKAPACKLYGVPAAQVPKQGSELYVFDKACSSKAVPNTKPTHDEPRGQVKGKLAARDEMCNTAPTGPTNDNIQPFATPSVKTADKCQDACTAQNDCQSFVFGLPADASAPVCKLYKVAPANVPSGDDKLNVFAKSCPAAKVPTTDPTHVEPRGQPPVEQKPHDKSADKPKPKPKGPPHVQRRGEPPVEQPPVEQKPNKQSAGKPKPKVPTTPPHVQRRGQPPVEQPPAEQKPNKQSADKPKPKPQVPTTNPPHVEARGQPPVEQKSNKKAADKPKPKTPTKPNKGNGKHN
ncbi:unnamed protein product [Fusarium graminearum]|nr:hypothetical protein FG05_11436 [Fusarium graminearum]CAG1959634.1 unnamed protein product [Fusarium graminearum]VTO88938.1 unnamed protein product [Fusarium graminearum]